jgi:hypothetical protein
MNKSMIALGAMIALSAIGCTSDCEVTCEASQECSNASPVFAEADCGDLCDIAEDVADFQGCLPEWDDAAACAANNEHDACTGNETTCAGENDRLDACRVSN